MKPDAQVRSMSLVLRVTMTDGTVVEGATRSFVPTYIDDIQVEEDARVFGMLDAVADGAPVPENPPFESIRAMMLCQLYSHLRRAPIEDRHDDGRPIVDLVELCFERLRWELQMEQRFGQPGWRKRRPHDGDGRAIDQAGDHEVLRDG